MFVKDMRGTGVIDINDIIICQITIIQIEGER
jgi:hypothetical protein